MFGSSQLTMPAKKAGGKLAGGERLTRRPPQRANHDDLTAATATTADTAAAATHNESEQARAQLQQMQVQQQRQQQQTRLQGEGTYPQLVLPSAALSHPTPLSPPSILPAPGSASAPSSARVPVSILKSGSASPSVSCSTATSVANSASSSVATSVESSRANSPSRQTYAGYMSKQFAGSSSSGGSSSGGGSLLANGSVGGSVAIGVGSLQSPTGLVRALPSHSHHRGSVISHTRGGSKSAIAGTVSLTSPPAGGVTRHGVLSPPVTSATRPNSARHSLSGASGAAATMANAIDGGTTPGADDRSGASSAEHSRSQSRVRRVRQQLVIATPDEVARLAQEEAATNEPSTSRLSLYRDYRRGDDDEDENPLEAEPLEAENAAATAAQPSAVGATSATHPLAGAGARRDSTEPSSANLFSASSSASNSASTSRSGSLSLTSPTALASAILTTPPATYTQMQPPPYSFSSPDGGSHYRRMAAQANIPAVTAIDAIPAAAAQPTVAVNPASNTQEGLVTGPAGISLFTQSGHGVVPSVASLTGVGGAGISSTLVGRLGFDPRVTAEDAWVSDPSSPAPVSPPFHTASVTTVASSTLVTPRRGPVIQPLPALAAALDSAATRSPLADSPPLPLPLPRSASVSSTASAPHLHLPVAKRGTTAAAPLPRHHPQQMRDGVLSFGGAEEEHEAATAAAAAAAATEHSRFTTPVSTSRRKSLILSPASPSLSSVSIPIFATPSPEPFVRGQRTRSTPDAVVGKRRTSGNSSRRSSMSKKTPQQQQTTPQHYHQQQRSYSSGQATQPMPSHFHASAYPTAASFSSSSIFQSFPLRVVFDVRAFGPRSSRQFAVPRVGRLVAGRYRMVRLLGRAAFSNAIHVVDTQPGSATAFPPPAATTTLVTQPHPLARTNSSERRGGSAAAAAALPHVCLKILHTRKDFFDQGLEEVRILAALNSAQDALLATVPLTPPLLAHPSPRALSKRGSTGSSFGFNSAATPSSSSATFTATGTSLGPSTDKFIVRLLDCFYFHETVFLVTDLLGETLLDAVNKSKACIEAANHGSDADCTWCTSLNPSTNLPSSSPEKLSRRSSSGGGGGVKNPSPIVRPSSKSPRFGPNGVPLSPLTLGMGMHPHVTPQSALHSGLAGGGGAHAYLFRLASVRSVAFQLATALEFVHAHGFAHADLKPENVLFDTTPSPARLTGSRTLYPRVKLIDFGSAVHCPNGVSAAASSSRSGAAANLTYIQSRAYRAPEVLLGLRSYGPAIDMWSLAAVLVELFTGEPLFPNISPTNTNTANSHGGGDASASASTSRVGSLSAFHAHLASLHKMESLFGCSGGTGAGGGFSSAFLRRILNQPPPPPPNKRRNKNAHAATATVAAPLLHRREDSGTVDDAAEEDDASDVDGEEDASDWFVESDNGSRVLHFFDLRAASSATLASSTTTHSESPLEPVTPVRGPMHTRGPIASPTTLESVRAATSEGDVRINILATPMARGSGVVNDGTFATPSASPLAPSRVSVSVAPFSFATPGGSPLPAGVGIGDVNETSPPSFGGCVYALKSLSAAHALGARPSPARDDEKRSMNDLGSAESLHHEWRLDSHGFDERAAAAIPREYARLHAMLTAPSVMRLHTPHVHTTSPPPPPPSFAHFAHVPSLQRSSSTPDTPSPDRSFARMPPRSTSRQTGASPLSRSPAPTSTPPLPPIATIAPPAGANSSSSAPSFSLGTASTLSEWCEWLDFLSRLLTIDPDRRLTASAALAHPFLAQAGGGIAHAATGGGAA